VAVKKQAAEPQIGIVERLKNRISALEAEIKRLRAGVFQPSRVRTVIVPETMRETFDAAQTTVHEYFQDLTVDPARGLFEIGGQRYVLIRASSLSVDFLDTLLQLYADRGDREAKAIGRSFLFDIAHSLGMGDARAFHEQMGLTDPIARLSAGPVHFAYCGWALVDIKPESNPVPNEDFFLIYDHPYSFEAAAWAQTGRYTDAPLCIMNAGYSSGWCEESFGIELTSVEISCQATGDETCTFIMAPPTRISERIKEFFGTDYADAEGRELHIPTYFDRKRAEEALREKAAELERAYQQLNAAHVELKESQSRNIQASRLASIGELAAGVAHELNSPLCVVQGYANLIHEELTASPRRATTRGYQDLLKKVNKIKTAAERCKLIVDDLLAFSRQSPHGTSRVDIAEVVDRTFDLIGVHFSQSAIQVSRVVPRGLAVRGNASQLQQVVTNIVMNSVQAIDQDGELTIRAFEDHDFITLEVTDNGPGIPQEHQDKIFDPFFTTKPMGKGTGLGLSIAYGIVQSHGGQIVVKSPKGGGTTFQIRLPQFEHSHDPSRRTGQDP
jgi:signal transduction histidine kinase